MKKLRQNKGEASTLLSGRVSEDVDKTKKIQAEVGLSRAVTQSERPNRMVQAAASGTLAEETFQGYLCDVCGRTYMDNASFLDHLNSRMHLANMGMGLEVKKSTIEEVKARIRYHVVKLHKQLAGLEESKAKDLENYDFDEQVERIKKEEEDAREQYFLLCLLLSSFVTIDLQKSASQVTEEGKESKRERTSRS